MEGGGSLVGDALAHDVGRTGGDAPLPDMAPVRFCIGRVTALDSEVRDLLGTVSAESGAIAIDGLSASFHGRGEHEQVLGGRIRIDPSQPSFEARLSGAFDFSRLAPVVHSLGGAGIAAELGKFSFPSKPPRLDAIYFWSPSEQTHSLRLAVRSGPMRYNGVGLSDFLCDVVAEGGESWQRVDFAPIEATRPEGRLSGSLSLDIPGEAMKFDCTSSVDPPSLAAMLGLTRAPALDGMVFDGPSEIKSSGVVGLGESGMNRTSAKFCASAADVTVRGTRLSDISVSGGFDGGVLDLPAFSASVMDGTLSGAARFKTGGKDGTAAATLSLDIRDARLFRVPLFAGMTGVLAKYVPGVDFVVSQSDAHVGATLDADRWNISGFSVSGSAFSIDGSGTAAADGTDLDIVARVRLLNKKTWLGRRIRDLLSPLSGLFGIRATGSLAEPHWSSAPFSRSSAK